LNAASSFTLALGSSEIGDFKVRPDCDDSCQIYTSVDQHYEMFYLRLIIQCTDGLTRANGSGGSEDVCTSKTKW